MTDKSDATTPAARKLIAKYGAELFENPPLITRERLERKLAQRDAVDQHFAGRSLLFASRMAKRRVLDERTRYLVQIGQFTITKSHGHLEDVLRAAIAAGVPVREALEPILLCTVYAGDTASEPALEVFTRVAKELGVLDRLRADQLPLDGHDGERDFEAERKTWPAELERDPRREELMRKHGWLGISTGLKYRGAHHLEILQYFDTMDPEFADLWLAFAYQSMYSRWVLDDKTRVLCTVGDCLAAGETVQAREHIRSALAVGATPREILEVIFLTAVNFGFPGLGANLRVFVTIIAEQGRLAEIGNPPVPPAGT